MKAHIYDRPERRSLEDLKTEPFLSFIAGAWISPVRPTLRAALLRRLIDGRAPLFHIEITPFDQTVLEVGWLEDGETPLHEQFDVVSRLPFPKCPTIVLPGLLIDPEIVVETTARWLTSMPHASLQWQRIKRHPGDPIGRLSGTDDDGKESLRPVDEYPDTPLLTDAEAWAFAQFILSEEHLRAEISEFFACWEVALAKQIEYGVEVDSRITLDRFKVWFSLIMGASRIPDHPETASLSQAADIPGPSDPPRFRRVEPPIGHPIDILFENPLSTMLFSAVVDAFRPQLFAIAIAGARDSDGWIPVLRLDLTPDGIALHEYARFKRGDRFLTLADCAVFTDMTPPSCPTLVAPGIVIDGEDTMMRALAEWIAPCEDAGRTSAAIRAHPGDPHARVQAAIDALAEPTIRKRGLIQRLLNRRKPARVENPVMTDEQAHEFVRLLSSPQHFWPELSELGIAWDHAYAIHQKYGNAGVPVRHAMTIAEVFLMSCLVPPKPAGPA